MTPMRFQLNLDPSRLPVGPEADPAGDPLAGSRDRPSARPSGRSDGLSVPPQRIPVLQAVVPAASTPPQPLEPAWFSAPLAVGSTLVVPAGACVRGDCQAEHVWVLGEVHGRVRATGGTVVVAAGARVRGGVAGAGPVVIAGRVDAPRGRPAVVAHGRLDIASTAHITGTVVHGVVALYEGARIDGDLLGLDRHAKAG